MIVRTWRARVVSGREDDYDRYARTLSLPMFRSLDGCVGVVFGRTAGEALVVSLWRDREAVAALARAPAYLETAARIEAEGLVEPGSQVEAFEVHGRWLTSPGEASPPGA